MYGWSIVGEEVRDVGMGRFWINEYLFIGGERSLGKFKLGKGAFWLSFRKIIGCRMVEGERLKVGRVVRKKWSVNNGSEIRFKVVS